MKIFKTVARVLVAIIIGIPSLVILYPGFTIMGTLFIIPIIGLFGGILNWLTNNTEGLEDSIDMVMVGVDLLIAPFAFWHFFIIGKNPLKEMGINLLK